VDTHVTHAHVSIVDWLQCALHVIVVNPATHVTVRVDVGLESM
jgi:hypothetical protein